MRQAKMPAWYFDLVRLTKERPDMTIEEKARMLGKSKSGVAHALAKGQVRALIDGSLATEDVESVLQAKKREIDANLQQSEILLEKLRAMVIVTGDALEGAMNAYLVDMVADPAVATEIKVATALRVREQNIDLRKAYAAAAPAGKEPSGAMIPVTGTAVALKNDQMMASVLDEIKKIATGSRRTTEAAEVVEQFSSTGPGF